MHRSFAASVLGLAVFAGAGSAQQHGSVEVDTLLVDGVQRHWRMYVPGSYDGQTPMPLVINFHGTSFTPERQARMSQLEPLADSEGFLVASPAGESLASANGRASWNAVLEPGAVDDVRFVREMIERISDQYSVDPKRIYATGYSGGARMSSRLACDLSQSIAAIGPVAGVRYPEGCRSPRAVPVMAFHGRRDPINPYELQPDSPTYWREGVESALSHWVTHNECDPSPVEEAVSATVVRISYYGCRDGAEVVFYRSDDAGHTWPGSPAAAELAQLGLGTTNSEIPATRLMWEFFQAHPMP